MNYYNKKIFIILGCIFIGYYSGTSLYQYFFDTYPPIITCDGIIPEEYYNGNIQININAKDEYKIKSLSIYIDEKIILDNYNVNSKTLIYPLLIPTIHLQNGSHILTIICTDSAKNKNSTKLKIPFYVDNEPLEISMLSSNDLKVSQGNVLHLQIKTNKLIKTGKIKTLEIISPLVLESKNNFIYEAFIPISTEEAPANNIAQIIIDDYTKNQAILEIEYSILAKNFKKQSIKLKNNEEKKIDDEIGQDFSFILENIGQTSPAKKLWQGNFYKPCLQAPISTEFGVIRTSFEKGKYRHDAIDFAAQPKSPVWACQDGIVIIKGHDNAGYGNMVAIDHGIGLVSIYGHLNNFGNIEVGKTIKKGTIVGFVGMTGYATGYHLHWEMRLQNIKINPMQWVADDI